MVACHLKSYRPDLGYGRITGEAYKDVMQHLFTCFSYLDLSKVLKTDNAVLNLTISDLKPFLRLLKKQS